MTIRCCTAKCADNSKDIPKITSLFPFAKTRVTHAATIRLHLVLLYNAKYFTIFICIHKHHDNVKTKYHNHNS